MVDQRAESHVVRDARGGLAAARAQLAETKLGYADGRRSEDGRDPRFGLGSAGRIRARPSEFAGDELAVLLLGDP